jgi:hypothetical protein
MKGTFTSLAMEEGHGTKLSSTHKANGSAKSLAPLVQAIKPILRMEFPIPLAESHITNTATSIFTVPLTADTHGRQS